MTAARRVAHWAPRIGIVVLVIAVALIVRRYDFERLPEVVRSLDGVVHPGALLIFTSVTPEIPLDRGTIVEAEVEVESKRWLILSQIAGMPGQELELRPLGSESAEIFVDDSRTWAIVDLRQQAALSTAVQLRPGPIPLDHVLLLDPADRQEAGDSRRLGFIPRAALRRKLIAFF